jgi:hypothetical protein
MGWEVEFTDEFGEMNINHVRANHGFGESGGGISCFVWDFAPSLRDCEAFMDAYPGLRPGLVSILPPGEKVGSFIMGEEKSDGQEFQ